MATIPPEITGRAPPDSSPLAVTVQRACELSGLGATSIWGFLKDGRLEVVRVPGFGAPSSAIPALPACSRHRLLRSRSRSPGRGAVAGLAKATATG
jgi:hypothetical protein